MKRLALAGLFVAAATSAAPLPVAGMWLTPGGKALVRVEPCGPQLCGRVVKVLRSATGTAPLDTANRDPALRGRPVVGLSILTGFTATGAQWEGRIYDPESGRSYRSVIERRGDTLDVKGCLGPFCRTQHWTANR